MSHFSVAVFSNNDTPYEELLKPYDENLPFPHYITKSEIIANVRKEIESYKNNKYAEYLKDPEGYVEKYAESRAEHIKYITQEFPKKLQWTDEECYADGIKYYDNESIRPDGSVFSTYNPNAKWDWYVVGGSFSKMIPLNDGTFCDEADMEEVNIEYRDPERYRRSFRFWQLFIDEAEPESDEDRDLIRFEYRKKENYTERYKNAEDYADASSRLNFYAAILPNGEWLEAGAMGWWGISFATPDDEKQWDDQKKDLIRKAKEENWHITMVDCHL